MVNTKEKLVCAECGGTNIQYQAWIDANTNEFVSHIDIKDGQWCDDCEEHVEFVNESEYSANIQYQAWIDVNTDKFISEDGEEQVEFIESNFVNE